MNARAASPLLAFVTLLYFCLLLCVTGTPAIPTRYVNIVNKCTSDYYYVPFPGANNNAPGSCPSQSHAVTGDTKCHWNTPTTQSGTFKIAGYGGKDVIKFAGFGVDVLDVMWSGSFQFCKVGGLCWDKINNVLGTPASCTAHGCSTDVVGPYGALEISLKPYDHDFYNLQLIEGFHVPIEFVADNNNLCYPLGAATPRKGFAANWQNWNSPSTVASEPSYKWVVPADSTNYANGVACTSDSQCATHGGTCGLAYYRTPDSSGNFFFQRCGNFSGYWSSHRVCAFQPSTTFFNCNTKLTGYGYNSAATVADLVNCDTNGISGTCYPPQGKIADQYCCGCANWNNALGETATPPDATTCSNTNAKWTEYVLPGLSWLKKLCPICYTYPYDDVTALTTCGACQAGINVQNYTLTLCPNSEPWEVTTVPQENTCVWKTGGGFDGLVDPDLSVNVSASISTNAPNQPTTTTTTTSHTTTTTTTSKATTSTTGTPTSASVDAIVADSGAAGHTRSSGLLVSIILFLFILSM